MPRRLIDADRDIIGDLLIVCVVNISPHCRTHTYAAQYILVVTPCGDGGKVRALLIMSEQNASAPGPNNGPGGSELSYY